MSALADNRARRVATVCNQEEKMHNVNRYGLGLGVVAALALGCGVPDAEKPLDGGRHNEHADGGSDAGPKTTGETIVDATSTTAWVYWDFSSGGVVSVSSPAASHDWDLAFRRTQIATNSGTSHTDGHPTKAGALNTSSTSFGTTNECPADGYKADALLPIPGPPGSGEYSGNPALADWFNYDPATHATSSKGLVYCLRTADGNYAKLTVVNYAGGQLTLRWRYQPDGTRAVP